MCCHNGIFVSESVILNHAFDKTYQQACIVIAQVPVHVQSAQWARIVLTLPRPPQIVPLGPTVP